MILTLDFSQAHKDVRGDSIFIKIKYRVFR